MASRCAPAVRAGLLCVLLAASAAAQSNDPRAAVRPAGERIIDVDAARQAKLREHGFHFFQVPLFPLVALDRGAKKGLLAVDRHHLLDKAGWFSGSHIKGFQPLFGGLGVRSGIAAGVRYYNNNFLGTGTRLSIPARISSRMYQEFGASISAPVAKERVFFDGSAFYRVRTRDDFFGLGNNSTLGGRSNYMLKSREFGFGPRFV